MKIGYLPGVFDLLHHGHINIIDKTANACDITIIGIHTDEFVAHYKRRPVQTENERLEAVRNYFGSRIHALEIVGSNHLEVIKKYGVTPYHRLSFRLLPDNTLFVDSDFE